MDVLPYRESLKELTIFKTINQIKVKAKQIQKKEIKKILTL